DKPQELWVNEVGVAPAHQGQGIGKQLMEALFAHGRTLGCGEAWVLTESDNASARRLYAAVGGEEKPAVLVSFQLAECGDDQPGRDMPFKTARQMDYVWHEDAQT
ncbi:MAG: GNAT family N-acetyltransferase, partial [Prosthecobacter sp.]|nr:GNAT family N-acetyltransferase [Prosthecobacter sp.]